MTPVCLNTRIFVTRIFHAFLWQVIPPLRVCVKIMAFCPSISQLLLLFKSLIRSSFASSKLPNLGETLLFSLPDVSISFGGTKFNQNHPPLHRAAFLCTGAGRWTKIASIPTRVPPFILMAGRHIRLSWRTTRVKAMKSVSLLSITRRYHITTKKQQVLDKEILNSSARHSLSDCQILNYGSPYYCLATRGH